VPVVETKTIVLMDDEPQKTAVIGASLDPAYESALTSFLQDN